MQIKTLLLTPLVAAGLVAAAPAPQFPHRFEVLTLRSGSPIHFGGLQASGGNIFLNLEKSDAKCDKKKEGSGTTFSITNDGKLFLYNKKTRQEVYVDRSGMGQGLLGYTTGVVDTPKNSERKGWKISKDGDLTFAGSSLIACPYEGRTYTVWANAGVANPGGNKDCLGFGARTVDVEKLVSCEFSS